LSNWYAVYTKSRAEKKLAGKLAEKGIEAYAPVRKVMKQWSDRKKMIEEPLIRSYCFVKVDPGRYQDVLNTPGAVRYVWFSGKPAPIPDRQIDILKAVAGCDIPCEPVTGHFEPGTRVRVIAGPLQGLEGELVNQAGKNRVIIRIDHLEQVLSLSISPLLIERISA
jgi:transcription antitermination factor NusG